tara:strand:+ start:8103 stop:8444 length:342 start_codon:yes stop_codon:yes gene_type:complete
MSGMAEPPAGEISELIKEVENWERGRSQQDSGIRRIVSNQVAISNSLKSIEKDLEYLRSLMNSDVYNCKLIREVVVKLTKDENLFYEAGADEETLGRYRRALEKAKLEVADQC